MSISCYVAMRVRAPPLSALQHQNKYRRQLKVMSTATYAQRKELKIHIFHFPK